MTSIALGAFQLTLVYGILDEIYEHETNFVIKS